MVRSKIKALILGASVTVITVGCGDQKAEEQTDAEQNDAGQLATVDSNEFADNLEQEIPNRVIVRIPVDQLGNPIGDAELRVAASQSLLSTEADVSAAFNAGKTAPLVSSEDELDADSSTQAWFLGNSWGRFGGHRGFGGWGGLGGWGGFAPQLGFGGGFHNFGFNQGFHFGGYRYGCFDRFGW